MKFTIGADPELFLKNQDKFISGIGLIGGSKQWPDPVGKKCFVQEDNVAAEFCIPPSKSADKFYEHIQYTLEQLAKRVPNLTFSHEASAIFDDDQLANPIALVFGCDPDYNAWTGKVNPKPRASNPNLRSAGGHVHVGATGFETKEAKQNLIRAMDIYLGVPSVKLDSDTRRRELYGKAGAYRPKPYGVEYRTLSNFWIWSKELTDWVYHQTSKAIDFASKNKIPSDLGLLIQECINTGNHKLHDKIVADFGVTNG